MRDRRSKLLTPEDAAGLIPNGATVSVSSSSGLGCPDLVLRAIGDRFRATGEPRGLTTVHPIAAGDMYGIEGIDHLAQPGLLKRVIAGSYPSGPSSMPAPKIWRMIDDDAVEAYNLPSGVLFDMHADAAAGRPGVLTKVGLDTFVDPRRHGGRMNAATTEELVRVVEFDGEEWLLLPSDPDRRLHRPRDDGRRVGKCLNGARGRLSRGVGTGVGGAGEPGSGDRPGGAGRRRGIAAAAAGADPEHSGRPDRARPGPAADDADGVRPGDQRGDAAPGQRVRAGAVGYGQSDRPARGDGAAERRNGSTSASASRALVPRILLEEGLGEAVTWVIEQGAVGGVPLLGFQFGCAANAQAIVPSPAQFTYFQGGGFDRGCLSFLQVDAAGNVNVSRLAARPHVTAGAGGFIDITARAPPLGLQRLSDGGRAEARGRRWATADHSGGRHVRSSCARSST